MRKGELTVEVIIVIILTLIIIATLLTVVNTRFKSLTGTETSGEVEYHYANSFEPLKVVINQHNKLVISKIPDKITINRKTSLFLQSCGNIDTSGKIKDKKIVIDPGHGYSAGNIGKFKEADAVKNVAAALSASKIDFEFTRDPSKELAEELTIEERKAKMYESDMAISLHAYKSPDKTENKIRVYVIPGEKNRESKKLGCLISNELKSKFPDKITGVEIKTEDNKENKVLPENKVSIRIELGNVDANDNLIILTSYQDISKAIITGIEKYYKK